MAHRQADRALVSDQAGSRLDPPGFDPLRERFPLTARLLARVAIFAGAFVAIGLLSATAKHFLGPQHLDLVTAETVAVYRGGLNMLLILWVVGLLRRDSDRSPSGGDAKQGSVHEGAGPQDIAQKGAA